MAYTDLPPPTTNSVKGGKVECKMGDREEWVGVGVGREMGEWLGERLGDSQGALHPGEICPGLSKNILGKPSKRIMCSMIFFA